MSNKKATEKVLLLKKFMTVDELTELIGVSRATLYTRLEKSNWKKTEKSLINQIKENKYVRYS